jgi:hypothetical protein
MDLLITKLPAQFPSGKGPVEGHRPKKKENRSSRGGGKGKGKRKGGKIRQR